MKSNLSKYLFVTALCALALSVGLWFFNVLSAYVFINGAVFFLATLFFACVLPISDCNSTDMFVTTFLSLLITVVTILPFTVIPVNPVVVEDSNIEINRAEDNYSMVVWHGEGKSKSITTRDGSLLREPDENIVVRKTQNYNLYGLKLGYVVVELGIKE